MPKNDTQFDPAQCSDQELLSILAHTKDGALALCADYLRVALPYFAQQTTFLIPRGLRAEYADLARLTIEICDCLNGRYVKELEDLKQAVAAQFGGGKANGPTAARLRSYVDEIETRGALRPLHEREHGFVRSVKYAVPLHLHAVVRWAGGQTIQRIEALVVEAQLFWEDRTDIRVPKAWQHIAKKHHDSAASIATLDSRQAVPAGAEPVAARGSREAEGDATETKRKRLPRPDNWTVTISAQLNKDGNVASWKLNGTSRLFPEKLKMAEGNCLAVLAKACKRMKGDPTARRFVKAGEIKEYPMHPCSTPARTIRDLCKKLPCDIIECPGPKQGFRLALAVSADIREKTSRKRTYVSHFTLTCNP